MELRRLAREIRGAGGDVFEFIAQAAPLLAKAGRIRGLANTRELAAYFFRQCDHDDRRGGAQHAQSDATTPDC